MYKAAAILASVFVFTVLVACPGPLPTPERTRGPSPPLDATALAKIPTATAAATPPVSTILVINISPIPPNVPDFDRIQWPHWTGQDEDCRNARQETLAAESVAPVAFETSKRCGVASGEWRAPYTGIHEDYPSALDVDHLVPLKNTHDSGGWTWSPAKKEKYANRLEDSDHLIAVTAEANRSKGERGPDEWRPPDESYWCRYATGWTEVKSRWSLTMTEAEAEAVVEMFGTCEDPPEVEVQAARVPKGATQETEEPASESSVYSSCEAAEAAGEQRVQGSSGGGRGFPKAMVPSARDGDGDGVVCER